MPDISRVVFIKSAPEGIRAISLGEELLLHGYQEIMGDDGLNRLTKGTNDVSVVERRYDSLSRLIEEVQDGKSVQYGYDRVGNPTSIRYPNQRLVEREFDLLNRVSRVKQGSDVISTMEFLGRSYRLASKGYQNGDLVKYLYDQGRRLTGSETKNKNQTILQSFGWGYDTLDLKSFEKRLHNGGKGDAFSYDALKRLTNVTFDSPTPETPGGVGVKSKAITLDKLDNILKITDNENAMVTEIIGELEGKGKALNQYSKFNDLPLEYDTNGNLSAKGSRLFSYDYRNRLIRSSKGDDAVTFTYDIFGRQTSRTDLSGTLHFFYAGDQKIEERNASGQVTKHYLWGNGIDELLRLDIYNGSSSTPYYIHTDNIGSTTAITDGSGNLVERVTYDGYGLPTFTDALGQTLKKSTIRNTTLFQGREYDYDLALYNYRARYLDPSLGRFLQTDPLGYQDSMNLYQGMGMNPVNFVDPRGEEVISYSEDIAVSGGDWKLILSKLLGGPIGRHSWLEVVNEKHKYLIELGGPREGTNGRGNLIFKAFSINSKLDRRPNQFPNIIHRPSENPDGDYLFENNIVGVAQVFFTHSDILPKYVFSGPNCNGFIKFLIEAAKGGIIFTGTEEEVLDNFGMATNITINRSVFFDGETVQYWQAYKKFLKLNMNKVIPELGRTGKEEIARITQK